MRWLNIFLIFVPISIIMHYLHAPGVWMFPCACLSIIPLAGLMGEATEELSKYRGQAIGGLMNATFGNATELIIAIIAVINGEVEVVRASIIGSIVGNLLLVLGLSLLLGGFKYKEQLFNRDSVEAHSSMMTIAVISLLVPAIFVLNVHGLAANDKGVENLSLAVAGILIALYIGNLIFSLRTHKSLFREGEEQEDEPPKMKQRTAFGLLFISTVLIAIESEFLVHGIEPFVEKFHLSKLFVGVILIPIIGNAAEHSTAVVMAMKNKMNISLNIAISSGTQIAMFVAPVVIIASFWAKQHVTIVFSNVELISIAAAVAITAQVTRDGKSNWLEGAQLLVAYTIIALAYFFISPH